MNCACRTKSLRIFVHSLTELCVTDPIIPRSVRLNHLGSPVRWTFPQHSTRLFSSSRATYSPGQKWSDNADDTVSATKNEEGQLHASIRGAADTINNDQPTLAPSASGGDLAAAKSNGAILDFTPESIDTLIANLDRTSITGQEDVLERQNNADSDAQSGSLSRSKPPITSSQLKRRKIVKEDKPRRSAVGDRGPRKEAWQIQKEALKEKFPEGWMPRKRLSPDALEGIRALHSQFPEQYTTEVLARHFELSPEAIRRILKSTWRPTVEEEERRQERWFNRGKNIWSHMAELGKKPPKKWRREGIVRKPHWNEKKGPRTEYPYVPHREEGQLPMESAQRKLSGNLF
ncbi:hypothetical protein GQX73_g7051 [Xylaria multiplex]|uniref:Required for respiratory growth protein 9, mitochondrial n=1 Tax=Xylaria multiplex TaxID=323545 RepID=A0A7C8MVG6_9PEZI|nr:hypothetical protein GQX73_g7051 [Xylaria multiplex]